MPEIRVRCARGEDQPVVRENAVFENHPPAGNVHGFRLLEQHGEVRRAAQDVADRRGDVARVELRRRDLVEEGLEEMMVAPVERA